MVKIKIWPPMTPNNPKLTFAPQKEGLMFMHMYKLHEHTMTIEELMHF